MKKIDIFLEKTKAHHPVHAKYLENISLEKEDREEFENLLSYYEQRLNLSIEDQVQCYLKFLHKNLEETKFFLEHHHYRYATFEEVKNQVYFNEDYMQKYMVGLAISSYLWGTHISARKVFSHYLNQLQKNKELSYLEVGPGHGEYFLRAIKSEAFGRCVGIDISPTSCKMTQEIVASHTDFTKADFLCKDFLAFQTEEKYDLITMGEVLEHVERPLEFLKKSRVLLNGGGGNFL